MGGTRQKIQLELAFTGGAKGEALSAERKGTEPSLARHEAESLTESERLMEAVCEAKNLKAALRRVKSNKGKPGIDGMTVEELPGWVIASLFFRCTFSTIAASSGAIPDDGAYRV